MRTSWSMRLAGGIGNAGRAVSFGRCPTNPTFASGPSSFPPPEGATPLAQAPELQLREAPPRTRQEAQEGREAAAQAGRCARGGGAPAPATGTGSGSAAETLDEEDHQALRPLRPDDERPLEDGGLGGTGDEHAVAGERAREPASSTQIAAFSATPRRPGMRASSIAFSSAATTPASSTALPPTCASTTPSRRRTMSVQTST